MHFLNSPSQKENISYTPSKLLRSPQSTITQSKRFLRFNTESTLQPLAQSTKNTEKTFFPESSLNIKYSNKESGVVLAYAAATDQGLVRNYNEDRVSIILNILKPPNRSTETWPFCSFFGIYDGHGGSKCADFLRDNLHQLIVCDSNFPFNPVQAIIEGFRKAESIFNSTASSMTPTERSGSCAIVVLIIGETCYIANVGDSRAVLSSKSGGRVYSLSKDHKPDEENERKRIEANGGKVYQSNVNTGNGKSTQGPMRVFPGRLSVSRTIGDVLAKTQEFGGNSKVVIGVPEVKVFNITSDHDFIVIASDGVFDKMTSREVVQSAWTGTMSGYGKDLHKYAGMAVHNIIKESMIRKSLDNLTAVIIGLNGFAQNMRTSKPNR